MATYIVQAPDGRSITLEGPAGASQAEAIEQAQRLYTPVPDVVQPSEVSQPAQPQMTPMPIGMDIPMRRGPEIGGPFNAAMIQAGATVDRLKTGAELLGARMFGTPEDVARIESEREQTAKLLEPVAKEYPKASFAGGILPYFALPGAAVSTLPRALATGATLGGVESGGDPLQTGISAASGGLGYGLGAGIGRAMSRARPPEGATPWTQELAEQGRDLGLRLTPAQATESQGLRIAERSARSSPFAAGSFQKLDDANQAAQNRIAARAIGEDVEQLTPDVLNSATTRIGGEFKRLTENRNIPLDDAFIDDLARIEAMETAKWGRKNALDKYVSDALDEAAKGTIDGKRYQSLRSALGKEAQQQMTSQQGDRQIGEALFRLQDALDNAASRVMSGDEAAAFANARQQWGMLRTLTDTNIVNEQGNVSMLKLANKLGQKDKPGYRRGGVTGTGTPKQDLYTAARWAQSFKQPGSSQTAERLSVPLNWMGAFATGGTLIPGMWAAGKSLTMPYPWQTGIFGLPPGTRDILARTGALTGMGASQ